MNNLKFRLEYNEIADILCDYIQKRLEKEWQIPQNVLGKLQIKVSFMNDYDGKVSHAEVEVKKDE